MYVQHYQPRLVARVPNCFTIRYFENIMCARIGPHSMALSWRPSIRRLISNELMLPFSLSSPSNLLLVADLTLHPIWLAIFIITSDYKVLFALLLAKSGYIYLARFAIFSFSKVVGCVASDQCTCLPHLASRLHADHLL